jgi:hypothetical protein
MVSASQLRANRANAKRSTGPTTLSGKRRSRMNAVKHGLSAKEITVGGEGPEEFGAFRDGLFADHKPVSALERELVERLAGLLWRLRRLPIVEAGLLNRVTDCSYPNPSHLTDAELDRAIQVARTISNTPGERNLSHAFLHVGVTGQTDAELINRVEMLNNLARYEASLMNGVTKTLTLLHALQAERAAAEAEANTTHGQPGKRSLTHSSNI